MRVSKLKPMPYDFDCESCKDLQAEVERLNSLIKHIYHYGTILKREDHEAMMNWKAKAEGGSDGTL